MISETQKLAAEKLGGVVTESDTTIDLQKTKVPVADAHGQETEAEASNKAAYPVGAVVATATVYLSGKETLEFVLPHDSDYPGTHHKQERLVQFSWTFRGCISPHAELDWKVIAFDGLGDLGFGLNS